MSITKTGIWTSPTFSNYLTSLYDPTPYAESDGSIWIRIFHHANANTKLFASGDSFITKVYKDEDRWFDVSICNAITGTWELMVKQKGTINGTERSWRWKQIVNPMIATFDDTKAANITRVTGNEYTTGSFGGIYKINSNTYLCGNNATNGNWWGSVGAWANHQGGIPAWEGEVVTTGYMNLYLRIDNTKINNASINEGGTMSPQFYEL